MSSKLPNNGLTKSLLEFGHSWIDVKKYPEIFWKNWEFDGKNLVTYGRSADNLSPYSVKIKIEISYLPTDTFN